MHSTSLRFLPVNPIITLTRRRRYYFCCLTVKKPAP
ncbi:TRASH domain-containing protein [Methylobacter sp.]